MTRFIAEVSSNHSQSLERCFEFIRISKQIGCHSVKFQLFKLDQLFSIEARNARPEFECRRQWELPVTFLPELSAYCKEQQIEFSCTPFYLDAVNELEPYVDFFKVASYELLWDDLLSLVAQSQKPVILSTGMATLEEIDHAVEVLQVNGASSIELLHCTSSYPTPVDQCNLAAIATLRQRYGLKVGWSDHSRNPLVVARAIEKWQASSIEFHLDIEGEGEEYSAGHCWLPVEMQRVIEAISELEQIDGSGIKKALPSEEFDRAWRADPSDGLRPLKSTRLSL